MNRTEVNSSNQKLRKQTPSTDQKATVKPCKGVLGLAPAKTKWVLGLALAISEMLGSWLSPGHPTVLGSRLSPGHPTVLGSRLSPGHPTVLGSRLSPGHPTVLGSRLSPGHPTVLGSRLSPGHPTMLGSRLSPGHPTVLGSRLSPGHPTVLGSRLSPGHPTVLGSRLSPGHPTVNYVLTKKMNLSTQTRLDFRVHRIPARRIFRVGTRPYKWLEASQRLNGS